MKNKIIFGLIFILSTLFPFSAFGFYDLCPGKGSTRSLPPPKVSGGINTYEIFDQYENNQKGMVILVSFDLEGGRCKSYRANAYFHFRNGRPLIDTNGLYCTVDNKVSSGTQDYDIENGYTSVKNLRIWIPYDELHLSEGTHQLKYKVQVFDGDGIFVGESEYNYFMIKPEQ